MNGIQGVGANTILTGLTNPSTASTTSNFSDFLKDALSQTAETDALSKTYNLQTITGEIDDIHTATIAATKAELALNLTLQMRNKMVESYQEIMRMQI